jgi:hypothetical protein
MFSFKTASQKVTNASYCTSVHMAVQSSGAEHFGGAENNFKKSEKSPHVPQAAAVTQYRQA